MQNKASGSPLSILNLFSEFFLLIYITLEDFQSC